MAGRSGIDIDNLLEELELDSPATNPKAKPAEKVIFLESLAAAGSTAAAAAPEMLEITHACISQLRVTRIYTR